MKGLRFEHRRRAVHCILACAACLWLLAWARLNLVVAISVAVVGVAIGHGMGLGVWNRLRRQIDERNVAVTYSEDSVLYALLVMLYLASLAPASMFRAGPLVARYSTTLHVILIGTSAACAGYTWVLYRRIRAHERRFGPLRFKRFYARSVVGPESLIGRRGCVVDACAPDGRVRVGAELWFARSLDGSPIAPGTHVLIRDVEGLRLIVGRRVEQPDQPSDRAITYEACREKNLRTSVPPAAQLSELRLRGVALGWRQLSFLIYAIVAGFAAFPLAALTIGGTQGALPRRLIALVVGLYGGLLVAIPYHYLKPWLIRERVRLLVKRAKRHIAAGRIGHLDLLLTTAKALDNECGGCASEQIRQLEAELSLHIRTQ